MLYMKYFTIVFLLDSIQSYVAHIGRNTVVESDINQHNDVCGAFYKFDTYRDEIPGAPPGWLLSKTAQDILERQVHLKRSITIGGIPIEDAPNVKTLDNLMGITYGEFKRMRNNSSGDSEIQNARYKIDVQWLLDQPVR